MAKKIDPSSLRYPLYLDVPMMVSVLASIEDGLPSLLGLLPADLRGRPADDGGGAHSEERQLVRRHTEASLFNKLRGSLRAGDAITDVDPHQIEQWTALRSGQLVEVTGEVVPDPLGALITFFSRFQSMLSGGMDQGPGGGRRQQGRAGQQRNDPGGPLDPQAVQILQWAQEDLAASTVRDALLRVGPDRDRAFVLTLARSLGTERSLDDLLGSQLTVLGKVTNTLAEGEEIDLLRRSALGYVSDQMQEVFDQIRDTPGMSIRLENIKVLGPTVQILPIAIFV